MPTDSLRVPRYRCAGWPLTAALLSVLLAGPGSADQSELTSRLDLGAVAVTSFHRVLTEPDASPPGWDALDESPGDHNLLGIRFTSELPLGGTSSSVEYAWSPNDPLNGADRHLVTLSLDQQWQTLRYGVRYFNAGADFGSDPLARNALAKLGIGAANQGGELWAAWNIEGITLEPRARHVAIDGAGVAGQIHNQYSLTATRKIGTTRLTTRLQRGHVESGLDAGAPVTISEADQLLVRLQHSGWQVGWTAQEQRRLDGSERRLTATREVSGALKLLTENARQPALNVGLKVKRVDAWNTAMERVEANLQVQKTLFGPAFSRGATSVDASIHYAREEQTHAGITQDGLGVDLTLTMNLNG